MWLFRTAKRMVPEHMSISAMFSYTFEHRSPRRIAKKKRNVTLRRPCDRRSLDHPRGAGSRGGRPAVFCFVLLMYEPARI